MMHFRILAIPALILFSWTQIYSQTSDTLVFFEDLSFTSSYEEDIFIRLKAGEEVALLDLYLAVNIHSEEEAERFKKKYRALRSSFEREGVDGMKDKKKIKAIYEDTHDALMIRYSEEALFPDLFREGSFNCVSGSMVYSLLFEEFGIPYQIQKGMNHVYLLAYPQTQTMLVETTDSEKGLIKLDQSDKEKYLEQLARGKMITPQESAGNSVTSMFLQYAFEKTQIDAYELASYQYSNQGIFYYNDRKLDKAYRCFEKAQYLKPNEVYAQMLLSTGAFLLHQAKYRDTADFYLLRKLVRYSDYGITEDDVLAEFNRISQKVFFEQSDTVNYRLAHDILLSTSLSEASKKTISIAFYGNLINARLEKNDMEGALSYLDDYYRIDSENEQVVELITQILVEGAVEKKNKEESLTFISSYASQFPDVYEKDRMKSFTMALYLELAREKFELKQAREGLAYLDKFEASYQTELFYGGGGAPIIVEAYEHAAFYYYEKHYYRQAKEMLDRGLKILPGNHRLIYLRKSL